jgi:hypothetical protein
VDTGETSDARVRAAVLDYLVHNGNAADTLEGIVNWWLPVEQRGIDRSRIELILDRLVADGAVKMTKLIDGTVLYSRVGKT